MQKIMQNFTGKHFCRTPIDERVSPTIGEI